MLLLTAVCCCTLAASNGRSKFMQALRAKHYPTITHTYQYVSDKTHHVLSNIQSIKCSGACCDIMATASTTFGKTLEIDNTTTILVPLRLVFWGPAIVRWWLAVDGNFSDTGTADDVIVGKPQNLTAALKGIQIQTVRRYP